MFGHRRGRVSAVSPPTEALPARPLLHAALIARPLWSRLAVAALAGAGAIGASVALTATSAWLLSRAAQHPSVSTLMVAIVGVRAFGISRGLLRYAERLAAHDAAFRVLALTRVRVFTALERLAPTGLRDYRSGDLLGRLVDDVDGLQDLYLRIGVPVAAGGLVGAGSVAALGWAEPLAGAALAVGLVLVGLTIPWWAARAGRRGAAADGQARAELAAVTVDSVSGVADLLAAGARDRQLQLVADIDDRIVRVANHDARVAAISGGLAALTTGATVIACLVLGIAAVRDGHLPGVLLATVVLLPLAAFEAVGGFPAAAQQLGRVRSSAARVLDILGRPAATSAPAPTVAAPTGPITLRLNDVSAAWPGADRAALSGIDLDLRPGARVAVVGPSGAGKSTLVAVLLGFLSPTTGQVTVGGVDLARLADEDIRRLLGACSQDAHVFGASIADNVRIGRVDATDAELRSALGRAGLLEWVDRIEHGLDTEVGEHGQRLSGGQRQRLALARELVADHPVVVLDEPTEHLEASLADALVRDLLHAVAGRTTILVTHQLAGLAAVDQIMVMSGGRIAQRGTHRELVGRAGWYRDAWFGEHGWLDPEDRTDRDLRP
jgi:thiol reductant ABC exporter CydC subunit